MDQQQLDLLDIALRIIVDDPSIEPDNLGQIQALFNSEGYTEGRRNDDPKVRAVNIVRQAIAREGLFSPEAAEDSSRS